MGDQSIRRRSIRLKGYDYSSPGAYYITAVLQDRLRLFGQRHDAMVELNDAGRMIERWWKELPNKFQHVGLDEYIVMPDHFHGIVIIHSVGADRRVCPVEVNEGWGAHTGAPQRAPISRIVQWWKTMTTNEYIREVKRAGWEPFCGRLWQRNYYEHVIRDDEDLNRVRQYIMNNPFS